MSGEQSHISTKLEQLRQTFFAGLPERMNKIQASCEALRLGPPGRHQEHLEALILALHSLAGTSATYGYREVSKHARAAERYLRGVEPSGDHGEALARLQGYLQAIHIDIEEGEHQQALADPALGGHLHQPLLSEEMVIYLADDDRDYLDELSRLLGNSGYRVEAYSDLQQLEAAITHRLPNVLLMDIVFQHNNLAGIHFVRDLRERIGDSLPVIYISAYNDLDLIYQASQASGCYYLHKPVEMRELLHTVEMLMSQSLREGYRVLIVEDDADQAAYASHLLQQTGMQTRLVTHAEQALAMVAEFRPEVILLDVHMPSYTGIELAAMIRMDPKQQFTAILFLSADANPHTQLEAIGLGGDDFLVKPVPAQLLIRTVQIRAQRARAYINAYSQLGVVINELEHFKVALDQHAIVSIANARGEIVYVNQKFCDISGYSLDELLGKTHNILNSGHHPRAFFSEMWQTIAAGNTWQGEIKNRNNQGGHYWVESTITPFLDTDGRPYQYVSIRTDITAQKETALALAESEARLRRSQNYANIGTWDWDIRSGELYWSERIGPLFGYDNVVATTYENFIKAVYPDDRQLVMDSVNACVQQGAVYDIEHRIRRADGEVRWLSEKGDVVRDELGMPLHMLGVVQDITARKLAEFQLMESRERLEQAQTRALLGNWEANIETGELYWSDIIYTIFGRNPHSYTPTVTDFFAAVHPEDREHVRKSEELAAKTGVHDVVHRILRPDGEVRYVHELAKAVVNEAGATVRLIGTVQDVTELKQTEQHLISAKEEAERANRAKSEFLSRMSHELRTPMNAILGFGQLLESDTSDPLTPSQTISINQILKAGWHLLDLINEVLDLSRIETGKLNISMEAVKVQDVIHECIALVSTQATQYDVTIEQQFGPNPHYVLADKTRFKQVYLNLLSNAIKYNRRGGRVTLGLEQLPNQRLRLSIADTGQGMSADQMQHLFEPFNRLGAEQSAIEGTGIGLVIAKRLVELMGGEISVHSHRGNGTTFSVVLKGTTLLEPSTLLSTDNNHYEVSLSHDDRPYLVLYVEDNPANLKLVQQILQRTPGVQLITEVSGLAGLTAVRLRQPDLVLLDINLPDMEGTEMAEQLRTDPSTRHIPLIALSANAMTRDVDAALKVGFREYLTKPLDVARFRKLIDTYKNAASQTEAG